MGFNKFDPYADEGNYLPFTLGESILAQFDLISNQAGAAWATGNATVDNHICLCGAVGYVSGHLTAIEPNSGPKALKWLVLLNLRPRYAIHRRTTEQIN